MLFVRYEIISLIKLKFWKGAGELNEEKLKRNEGSRQSCTSNILFWVAGQRNDPDLLTKSRRRLSGKASV